MPMPHGRFKSCKVTLARVTAKTVWAFLEVELDSGACGVGEITLPQSEARLIETVERLFQTWDGEAAPTSYEPPLDLADAAVRSGLDQAWHDATARESGDSLSALLGGERETTIPLYANINRRTIDRTAAGFSVSARYALNQGYAAVKIAPFDEVTPEGCRNGTTARDMKAGLERIAAVRNVIGEECCWLIAIGGLTKLLRFAWSTPSNHSVCIGLNVRFRNRRKRSNCSKPCAIWSTAKEPCSPDWKRA